MSLTEIMSGMRLEIWAEIGLLLFLLLFAGVLAYTFAVGNRTTFARAVRLPLDDDPRPGCREDARDE